MIAEQDLSPIVNELLDAFPMFDRWFADLDDRQRDGMIKSWTRQVANLHPADVRAAADRILDGRVAMPKNYEFDRLGFELRTWGGVEAAQRIEREKSETLREQARPTADSSTKAVNYRFGPSIKCAASWGTALRAGYVTEQQNADAMALIHRYHKQGDVELPWPEVPETERKSVVEFWKVRFRREVPSER